MSASIYKMKITNYLAFYFAADLRQPGDVPHIFMILCTPFHNCENLLAFDVLLDIKPGICFYNIG